jgi:hypothetical protein
VRKLTENDAKSQRVLLNLKALEKNKKVEEQEKKIGWTITTSRAARAGASKQQPGRILETVNSDNKKI